MLNVFLVFFLFACWFVLVCSQKQNPYKYTGPVSCTQSLKAGRSEVNINGQDSSLARFAPELVPSTAGSLIDF